MYYNRLAQYKYSTGQIHWTAYDVGTRACQLINSHPCQVWLLCGCVAHLRSIYLEWCIWGHFQSLRCSKAIFLVRTNFKMNSQSEIIKIVATVIWHEQHLYLITYWICFIIIQLIPAFPLNVCYKISHLFISFGRSLRCIVCKCNHLRKNSPQNIDMLCELSSINIFIFSEIIL